MLGRHGFWSLERVVRASSHAGADGSRALAPTGALPQPTRTSTEQRASGLPRGHADTLS
jgi:hypothetical protein